MDLWGFTDWQFSLPAREKIKSALKLAGSDKIILHDNDNVIQFKLPGMKIDLGGIAKGYAVDCAVTKLKEAGIKNCLINAGGQIYCLGDNLGRPWKVAIKGPRGRNFLVYLKLRNKAVSTSGDYEQYFIKNNTRFSHIFNPKTGYPADSKIISVTIIADSGLIADALSTAVFVLGKEKGEILIKQFKGAEGKITESE